MNLKRLHELINMFKSDEKKSDIDGLLNYYKDLNCIEDVINKAAMATTQYGKKHSHQWRLKNEVLEKVKQNMLRINNDFLVCKDFECIYKLVRDCAVKGFGKLAIYDTSLRIGAYLRIFPKSIYLHAGARQGAKALGLNKPTRSIGFEGLPEPLCQLKPYEVEAFFCIYKGQLAQCR